MHLFGIFNGTAITERLMPLARTSSASYTAGLHCLGRPSAAAYYCRIGDGGGALDAPGRAVGAVSRQLWSTSGGAMAAIELVSRPIVAAHQSGGVFSAKS